jgi:hypothetical protein
VTADGALDIKIGEHVIFPPIGADYVLTRLQNVRSATDNNQNSIRVIRDLNFTLCAQQELLLIGAGFQLGRRAGADLPYDDMNLDAFRVVAPDERSQTPNGPPACG